MTMTENNDIYFVIPTINGEISGVPYVLINKRLLEYIDEEVIIYKINCISLTCIEV